jgi:hypothetical protein
MKKKRVFQKNKNFHGNLPEAGRLSNTGLKGLTNA